MSETQLRQRNVQGIPETLPTLGAGAVGKPKEPHPTGEIKYGPVMQTLRMLLFSTWFAVGCISIQSSQLIGCPLYLINKDYYYAYMANSKEGFCLLLTAVTQVFAKTTIKISWEPGMRDQFRQCTDGDMQTFFPERLILLSNHQIYTDWAFLWWTAYTSHMAGHIYFILKESLKRIPVIGWGMHFYGFIFMARKWASDKARLQYRLRKFKTEHTSSMFGTSGLNPMWLMIFPEGTNLSANTRKGSVKWAEKQGIPDLKNVLLPRSTGLQFCLEELGDTVEWVYDCTIGYEGIPPNGYAQDYFTLKATYFQGRPPKSVSMYWRRFATSKIPINDPKAFESWLLERWKEKDQMLEEYYQTGAFPSEKGPDGKVVRTKDRLIETEMRLHNVLEFTQIFVVLATLATVYNIISKIWSFFT